MTEREKYELMWGQDAYRERSPGLRLVPKFCSVCNPSKGDTVLDVGCGTGRASVSFEGMGLEYVGLDIAGNSVNPDVYDGDKFFTMDFLERDTWLEYAKFDWVYCCDVLEHLPSDQTSEALDRIKKLARKGVFLQISCFPETSHGKLIGEELHLTVQEPSWWMRECLRRWSELETLSLERGRLIVWAKSDRLKLKPTT